MDAVFLATLVGAAGFGIGDVLGQHGGLLKNMDVSSVPEPTLTTGLIAS